MRDELVTLLLAGHETTATGLAWCFDLLLHNPAVRERARSGRRALPRRGGQGVAAAAAGDPGRRPGRPRRAVPAERLRDPARSRDQPVDPRRSTAATTCTRTPSAFRPERFLADDPPDTYTWIPFGGGTRRCLGASFALMEMRIVVARVLERATLAGRRSASRRRSSSAGSRSRRRAASASSRSGRRRRRSLPRRHRPIRVRDPVAPRADVQRAAVAGELERQHLVRRGHAGPAVRAYRVASMHAGGREPLTQRVCAPGNARNRPPARAPAS